MNDPHICMYVCKYVCMYMYICIYHYGFISETMWMTKTAFTMKEYDIFSLKINTIFTYYYWMHIYTIHPQTGCQHISGLGTIQGSGDRENFYLRGVYFVMVGDSK